MSSQQISKGMEELITNRSRDVFVKSDPTSVEKYSNGYGSLEEELRAVNEMNQIIPEYVPDVVDVRSEDGEVQEIHYELVDGDTVEDISRGFSDESVSRSDYRGLEQVVDELHENGIAHGDLNRRNVMYGSDGWTLVDPAGILESDEDYDEAVRDDAQRLGRIEGVLERSRHTSF
jgi:tRNA A-37 threonylcarbamoyl transferase component Bud32